MSSQGSVLVPGLEPAQARGLPCSARRAQREYGDLKRRLVSTPIREILEGFLEDLAFELHL